MNARQGWPSSEHVLASIADPGAGPSHSVTALVAAMARHGADVGLHTVAGWRDVGAAAPEGLRHAAWRQDYARWPVLGRVCASREMATALIKVARTADILHGHGLWLMPNVYPAAAVKGRWARLVISPRGMLAAEAMAFSRHRKRAFWRRYQEKAARAASLFHATSEAEFGDIRAAGLAAPVAIIPNGVELPSTAPERTGPKTVLSLGRIHPKKGLDRLIAAWALVEAHHPDWRLRIVGPAERGHDAELRAQAHALGLARVSFEGPAYGEARWAAYGGADLFVLPTLSDNFAMTVAEALGSGAPVIATRGAPWAGLEREGCGWWVEHGPEPLAAALRQALSLPRENLRTLGERGRKWMARAFSWDRAAADMLAAYAWLRAGGDPPPTVRLA